MVSCMRHNGWYMLSGRISESVPVRRTRDCDARIRSWRTAEPALQYVLCYKLLFISFISFSMSFTPSSLALL
ncbi:MAG: hypothetical protein FD181_2945 [Prolixibacteraceae bacterium]|nr:MAG: hypothetical protein FD181_2945 [Prolixibacteraceae bacterium]